MPERIYNPITAIGFSATLRGKHRLHPIVVMRVLNSFEPYENLDKNSIKYFASTLSQFDPDFYLTRSYQYFVQKLTLSKLYPNFILVKLGYN